MLWQVLLLMENGSAMQSWKPRSGTKLNAVGCSTQLSVDGSIWVVITSKGIQNVKTTGVLGLAVVYLTNVDGVVICMLNV